MSSKTPSQRKEIADLLQQLAAAESEVESISNKELNKAVDAASHAMLLREAQEAIRDAEGRLERLVEFSPLPIFVQCEGTFADANQATLHAFGAKSADELLGKSVCDFVHPDFRSSLEQQMTNLNLGEVQTPIELSFFRFDGSIMYAEMGAIPVIFHGQPAGQVILRDITKRKLAERNFAHSLALASVALESNTDGILVVDHEGKIVRFNEKFAQMWNLPRTILQPGNEEQTQQAMLDQLKDPEGALTRIAELNNRIEEDSFEILEAKDGRLFERYSHPHRVGENIVGRVWSFRDITEQRRSEEALTRSELRFRQVWNHSSDGMRLANSEGIIVMVNDAFCQMIGKPRHEIEGRSIAEVYRTEQREHITKEHKNRFANRTVKKHFEKELILWNGKKVWFEVANSFVEPEGEPPLLLGIFRDVTQRKQIELRGTAFSKLGEQLNCATTEEQAARIIAEVSDDLLGWDNCSLMRYVQEQNLVHVLLNVDLVDGEKRDVPSTRTNCPPLFGTKKTIEEGAQLILRQHPHEFESGPEQRFGDKNRPSTSLMFAPIRHSSRIIGVLSIQSYSANAYDHEDLNTLQDLADHCGGALERIRAEQALRRSEMHFHSIWKNSVDGMRITDENGTIVGVNDAYCKLVGMTREELEGQPFSIVYAEENQRDSLEKYRTRFQQRVIEKTLNRRLTFRNGKVVDLEDTNSFIEGFNQRPLLLALFRDITQQKRLEDELRHSQKMESVGQLAGGIAHDFNNILTVIQGHASLLQLDKTLTSKVSESIFQISHVADRAANLTRQLLAFSRKQVIQAKSLDLNEVVSTMTKLLQRVLGEHISLHVNFVAKLPIVRADPGMIEQILMNLAVNSRDAMPRGGNLYIATSPVDVKELSLPPDCKPGKYVYLDIRDTGCGIPKEIQPRIFEPFFTTKDVGKGTGLGLATVYGIVKQHNGWIDMQSEVGRGTSFQIYLPAVSENQDMTEKKSATPKMKGGNETILLVEDEVEVRSLAKLILSRLGYQLFEAASGVSALQIWELEKERIDLVVTDIVMPDGMTGRELADRLQSEKPTLKVVFCSGYSTEMIGQDSILQEGINFLQKPYTPQQLSQIVRDRLDKKFIG